MLRAISTIKLGQQRGGQRAPLGDLLRCPRTPTSSPARLQHSSGAFVRLVGPPAGAGPQFGMHQRQGPLDLCISHQLDGVVTSSSHRRPARKPTPICIKGSTSSTTDILLPLASALRRHARRRPATPDTGDQYCIQMRHRDKLLAVGGRALTATEANLVLHQHRHLRELLQSSHPANDDGVGGRRTAAEGNSSGYGWFDMAGRLPACRAPLRPAARAALIRPTAGWV